MRKILTTLLISLIIMLGIFFVNPGEKPAKAMGTPDNNGYAECWYRWSNLQMTGVVATGKKWLMAIAVFRNTDGNYDGYAVTGCADTEVTTRNIRSNACTLTNYDSLFSPLTSSLLGQKFRGDLTNTGEGNWTCPNIYVYVGDRNVQSTETEISWVEKSGYRAVPGQKGTIAYNNCQPTGKPTLNDDSIDNTNPYANDPHKEGESDKSGIYQWGQNDQDDYSYEDSASACAIIGEDLQKILSIIFWIISIIGIIALIALTIIEFVKVITLSEEDGLKGAFKHTLIRIGCVIILFLLPMIIGAIIGIVNNSNIETDETGNPKIGENGEPLCKIANS